MNKKRIYREWRVGDKCWFGDVELVVERIDSDDPYPIIVSAMNTEICFTLNGSYWTELNDKVLTFVKGEVGTMPFDYEQLKLDDLVYVNAYGIVSMRYFSHYDMVRGGVWVFPYQQKSTDARYDPVYYSEYSTTNPLI